LDSYGFQSKSEDEKISEYCFRHADRVANGENVINDLFAAGVVHAEDYGNATCASVNEHLRILGGLQKIIDAYHNVHSNDDDDD
jgi:hypothetical protein